MGGLVTIDWLAAELARNPDLLVLDATKYLPGDGRDAKGLFAQARIPGARFYDHDAFSDPTSPLPGTVPTPQQFAAAATALGLSNSTPVVVYDQLGLFSAARAWWLLRLFGHEAVYVLDGGLPAWQAGGQPLETGAPAPPVPSGGFTATLHADRLRQAADLLPRDGATELVLDARAAGRFSGAEAEPRPGMRSGHIPGSRSLPYTRLLRADKTLRSPDELRAIFDALGAGAGQAVVTSCGSGVTAAVLTLARHVAGLPEGALYDGSWSEWGARADLPLATGADPAA